MDAYGYPRQPWRTAYSLKSAFNGLQLYMYVADNLPNQRNRAKFRENSNL